MIDKIAIALTAAVGDIVPFYYSEAEEDTYPYAVYNLVSTPVYTKDGVHRIDGSVTLSVFAEDLDNADRLMSQIDGAITAQMNNSEFSAHLIRTSEECVNGIWSENYVYLIKQFNNGRI